jgi:hypothetical protein
MTAMTVDSQAAILSHVIASPNPHLSPDAARFILSLTFDQADRDRMDELAEKARQGTLRKRLS